MGRQFNDWPHEGKVLQSSDLACRNLAAGTNWCRQKLLQWPVRKVKGCSCPAWRTKTWLHVESNMGRKRENWPYGGNSCIRQPWHGKVGLQPKQIICKIWGVGKVGLQPKQIICKIWGVTCDQELQGPTDVVITQRGDVLNQLAAIGSMSTDQENTKGKRSNLVKFQFKMQLNAQPSVGRKCEIPGMYVHINGKCRKRQATFLKIELIAESRVGPNVVTWPRE